MLIPSHILSLEAIRKLKVVPEAHKGIDMVNALISKNLERSSYSEIKLGYLFASLFPKVKKESK
jgi:hypothetical protein